MKAKYYVKQKMNNQLYKTNNNFSHSLSHTHILDSLLDPSLFVGRAPEQVKEFLIECVDPILVSHAAELSKTGLDAVNV